MDTLMPPIPASRADQDDLGAQITRAQDQLLRVEQVLRLQHGDESAPMFAAMASFAGVLGRVVEIVEHANAPVGEDDLARLADLAAARCVKELRHTTDELKETVMRDIRAGGFREITGAADRLVRQRNKHFAMWSGAVVMAAFLIGGAIVWRWQPTLQCTPQQNGGIYCGYWLTLKTKQ
jgi:hypothetical protein